MPSRPQHPEPFRLAVEELITEMSRRYGVGRANILGGNAYKSRKVSDARMMTIVALRNHWLSDVDCEIRSTSMVRNDPGWCALSMPIIGRLLNLNHSTVLQALKRARKQGIFVVPDHGTWPTPEFESWEAERDEKT